MDGTSLRNLKTRLEEAKKIQRSNRPVRVSNCKDPTKGKRVRAAKIIDCPQDLAELRMLVNKWNNIDRSQKRRMSQLDSEIYLMKLKYKELLTGRPTTMSEDMYLLPPGFRYHANGEPKTARTGPKRLTVTPPGGKQRIQDGASDRGESDKSVDDEIEGLNDKRQIEVRKDRALQAISRKIAHLRASLTQLSTSVGRNVSSQTLGRSTPLESCQSRATVSSSGKIGPQTDRRTPQQGCKDDTIRERWKSVPTGRYVPSPLVRTSSSKSSTPTLDGGRGSRGSVIHKPRTTLGSACRSTPTLDQEVDFNQTSSLQRELFYRVKRSSTLASGSGRGNDTQGSECSKSQNILCGTPLKLNVRETESEPSPKNQTKTKDEAQKQIAVGLHSGQIRRTKGSENREINGRRHSASERQTCVAASTEDSYRYVMRRAAITDEDKLSMLRNMLTSANLESRQDVTEDKCAGRQCRLHVSNLQHVRSQAHVKDEEGVKREQLISLSTFKNLAELETQASKVKVDDFLKRLPTPDVSISRWRTSSGNLVQITRTAAGVDGESTAEHVELCDVDGEPLTIENHPSDAEDSPSGCDQEEEERLLWNTCLTAWPNHWAQRASLANRQPWRSRDFETDARTAHCTPADEDEMMREFNKLCECRYLRIPPRLSRPPRKTTSASVQAWV